MLRLGLIGFGVSGRFFHVPVIRSTSGLDLACIVDRSSSRAAAEYPGVRIVRTVEELLADPEIDICSIVTPNATHFAFAQQCLRAGRVVVVDKPFTLNASEAAQLCDLAQSTGSLLTVFQNRRWDADFLTVKKLLGSGELGRLLLLESNFDRFRPQLKPTPWREHADSGGGALLDIGAHLIDQAIALFGPPLAVAADLSSEREGSRVDDSFEVRLTYPGFRAVLKSSAMRRAPGPRFVLHGTRGSFVKHGIEPQEELLRDGQLPSLPNWGREPESQWGLLYEIDPATSRKIPTEAGNYRSFYENLRDTLLKRQTDGNADQKSLAIPAVEALWTMHALDLARKSVSELRTLAWNEHA